MIKRSSWVYEFIKEKQATYRGVSFLGIGLGVEKVFEQSVFLLAGYMGQVPRVGEALNFGTNERNGWVELGSIHLFGLFLLFRCIMVAGLPLLLVFPHGFFIGTQMVASLGQAGVVDTKDSPVVVFVQIPLVPSDLIGFGWFGKAFWVRSWRAVCVCVCVGWCCLFSSFALSCRPTA